MINEKVGQLKKMLLSYCKKHPERLAELQPALDIIEKLLQSGEDTPREKIKSWWTDILSKIISNFFGHLLEEKFDEMTSNDDEDL
ncbi:MAG: hypothetical protein RLZZ628_275 [Bacteroidota bacterium]|jgi:hypothetical protein